MVVGGSGGKEERILVSVRIQPLNEKEIGRNDAVDWECTNDYTIISKKRPPASYIFAMEIYNEAVKDLLNPENGPLRLLDDAEKGTIVERLMEERIRDQEHLKELLSICEGFMAHRSR